MLDTRIPSTLASVVCTCTCAMCVCVCVCVWQREREKLLWNLVFVCVCEREKLLWDLVFVLCMCVWQTERERERERERESESERDRETVVRPCVASSRQESMGLIKTKTHNNKNFPWRFSEVERSSPSKPNRCTCIYVNLWTIGTLGWNYLTLITEEESCPDSVPKFPEPK